MAVIAQVIDKLTRTSALLVLLQKRKVGDMKIEGSSDWEITESKILREVSKTRRRIAALNFGRADFRLFRNLDKIP